MQFHIRPAYLMTTLEFVMRDFAEGLLDDVCVCEDICVCDVPEVKDGQLVIEVKDALWNSGVLDGNYNVRRAVYSSYLKGDVTL